MSGRGEKDDDVSQVLSEAWIGRKGSNNSDLLREVSRLGSPRGDSLYRVVDNVSGLPDASWVREVTQRERSGGTLFKLLLWFLVTNHTAGAWACRVGYPAVASSLQRDLRLTDGQIAAIGTAWAVGSLLAVFVAPKVFAFMGPRAGSFTSACGVPLAALLFVLALHLESFALVVLSHALEGVSAVCTLTFQNVFLNAFFPDGKDMRMAFAWDGVWRAAVFAGSPTLASAVDEALGLSGVAWTLVAMGGFSVGCNAGLSLMMRNRG
eukprot:Hpha_TRINITY_DN26236_c0_g1::TRINITY_DN26236_c0_g1_i1::g.184626::m.184626